mmetsp:Transcript_31304/g.86030  ORF Transcript_31304/g.86030 Transcript_31304/m.86030 type:complete len:269 (+) Transcript_31304:246-1052(+)
MTAAKRETARATACKAEAQRRSAAAAARRCKGEMASASLPVSSAVQHVLQWPPPTPARPPPRRLPPVVARSNPSPATTRCRPAAGSGRAWNPQSMARDTRGNFHRHHGPVAEAGHHQPRLRLLRTRPCQSSWSMQNVRSTAQCTGHCKCPCKVDKGILEGKHAFVWVPGRPPSSSPSQGSSCSTRRRARRGRWKASCCSVEGSAAQSLSSSSAAASHPGRRPLWWPRSRARGQTSPTFSGRQWPASDRRRRSGALQTRSYRWYPRLRT